MSLGRRDQFCYCAVFVAFILAVSLVAVFAPTPAGATIPCSPGSCITGIDDEYTIMFDPNSAPFKVTKDDGVLANDFGPNGTVVAIPDSDSESWGGASIGLNQYGAFTYRPNPSIPFSGEDSFSYTLRTASGEDFDWATVTIHVIPVVTHDHYVAVAGQPLQVGAAHGLFANDAGVDRESILPDIYSAAGGDLDVQADGSFSYLPPAGFVGIDSFEYIVSDLNFDNDYTATVTLDVMDNGPPPQVPDAPTIDTARPREKGADVTWTPPAGTGNPLTSYTVTPHPAGPAVTVPASATHALVAGLADGTSYTFTVTATNAAGSSAPSAPSNSIVPGPTIAIGDRMVAEGASGKRTVTFPVTLSSPATREVSVNYAVTNGSGVAAAMPGPGVDLQSKDGTLRFKPNAAGVTTVSKAISVTIFGDTQAEVDETFTVELSNPTGGYALARGTGVGSIVDDDGASFVATLGDVSIATSRSKSVAATLVVGLSAPAIASVTLRYTVSAETAGHSAKATGGGWYGGKSTATFTIPAGKQLATIRVPLWAQPLRDPATFRVTLSLVSGSVTVARSSAVVTVLPF